MKHIFENNDKQSLTEFICERFVTALNKDDMKKYIDIVWPMIVKAYEPIGGTAGMNSPEQLIKETDIWKMVRKNGKIIAVRVYSTKRGGRKSCYCATDGTKEGKEALYKIIEEDMKREDRQAWAECSGKMEHIYLKHGATPIPADIAQMIMKDKKFDKISDDGYHYNRKIGGEPHEKMMVGNLVGIKNFMNLK